MKGSVLNQYISISVKFLLYPPLRILRKKSLRAFFLAMLAAQQAGVINEYYN
jgi:hypothetical protein